MLVWMGDRERVWSWFMEDASVYLRVCPQVQLHTLNTRTHTHTHTHTHTQERDMHTSRDRIRPTCYRIQIVMSSYHLGVWARGAMSPQQINVNACLIEEVKPH